jgi:hypothetical protein
MKNKLVLFSGSLTMCLTACGSKVYGPKDYVLKTGYSSNYRILQLTDTHIGDKDNTKLHYDFMDLTIKEANPDFIVITGDVFTFASKGTAKDFFKWLDSYNIPWTLTFGNHDEQCWFSIDWLTGYLNGLSKDRENGGSSHCFFLDRQDDNVKGNANFAINLMQGTDVFEQLIIMDSNRYNYNGYFGYDYFHQDQIDWYRSLINYTASENGNVVVPSLMFYHIPLPEVRDAWAAAEKDKSLILNPTGTEGQQNEEPCNPDYNSGFYKVIKELGSTHGMYFGHDHINNYIINYEGIHFGYGIKATDRVYADDSLLGGRVIVLHDDHSLSYEDYYHTYKEVM